MFILSTVDSAIIGSLIGGIFLLVNTVTTIAVTRLLDKRERDKDTSRHTGSNHHPRSNTHPDKGTGRERRQDKR